MSPTTTHIFFVVIHMYIVLSTNLHPPTTLNQSNEKSHRKKNVSTHLKFILKSSDLPTDVVSEAFLRVWSKVAQALFNLVALEQMLNRYKMNLPLTVKRMTNKKRIFVAKNSQKTPSLLYDSAFWYTSSRLLSTINPNQNNKPYWKKN